jgi:hypothetical protein
VLEAVRAAHAERAKRFPDEAERIAKAVSELR